MASPEDRNQKKQQQNSVALIRGTCAFCGFDTEDEEKFGKKYTVKNLSVHYFCMLFSSGLCQNGESDNDGIAGFLQQDIFKELKRAYRLRCSFCKKRGATIGCVVARCRMVFHLPCGQEKGILTQFTGQYVSYCGDHRPRQSVPSRDLQVFNGPSKPTCAICMCNVESSTCITTLKGTCCKNSWYHRQCLQRHASCSGIHFFRCPLCNNKDGFQQEMLIHGIYIPDQDAAWEQEPNAFQELYQRHNRCDCIKCKCPKGPDFQKEGTRWEIMLCDDCGSQGTHLACSYLKTGIDDWVCRQCKEIGRSLNKEKKAKKSPAARKQPVDKNWLEKKIKAMKSPTVPASKNRKRKRDSSISERSSAKKKKLSLGASATCTTVSRNSTVTLSTLNGAASSSNVQHDGDIVLSENGVLPWVSQARLLGKRVKICLIRMTPEMISRANWVLAERHRLNFSTHASPSSPSNLPSSHIVSHVANLIISNQTSEQTVVKMTLEEFVLENFSTGDSTRVSHCDRIKAYQTYLDTITPVVPSQIQMDNSNMSSHHDGVNSVNPEPSSDEASMKNEEKIINDALPENTNKGDDLVASCEESSLSTDQSCIPDLRDTGTPKLNLKVSQVWSLGPVCCTPPTPSYTPTSRSHSEGKDSSMIDASVDAMQNSPSLLSEPPAMTGHNDTKDFPKIDTSDDSIPNSNESPATSSQNGDTDLPTIGTSGDAIHSDTFHPLPDEAPKSSHDHVRADTPYDTSSSTTEDDITIVSANLKSPIRIDLTSTIDPEQDILYIVSDPENAGGDFIRFPDNNQRQKCSQSSIVNNNWRACSSNSNLNGPCHSEAQDWTSRQSSDPIVLSDDEVTVVSVTPGTIKYCCRCNKRKKRHKSYKNPMYAYPYSHTLVPENVGPML